jgi:hypothetical protein
MPWQGGKTHVQMQRVQIGGGAMAARGVWLTFLQFALVVWVIMGATSSVANSVTCQSQDVMSMNFCLFRTYFGFLSFLLLAVSLVDSICYSVRLVLLGPYVLSFLIDIFHLFLIIDLDRQIEVFIQYSVFCGLWNFLVVLACIVLFRAECKGRGDA